MRLLLILFIFLSKINAETLIHTSLYIDGISDASKTNSSIIVENGKIKSISRGYIDPNGYDYIDLKIHLNIYH